MLKEIGKKGAIIGVKTIVIIAIVALSFIVILFFLGLFDFSDRISKDTCKQSVVFRHNAQVGPFEAKERIPLKCQTSLVCLSMSGNDCGLVGTKDNQVRKVKLSNDKQIAKNQIMEEIGNEMVECHNMLGEGKMNFMPQKWGDKNYGLICSRIAFDKKARDEIKKVGYLSFYKSLEEKKFQSGKSYLEYLYGQKSSDYFRNSYDEVRKKYKEEHSITLSTNYGDWAIDLTSENGQVLVAQIKREGNWDQWISTIAVAGVTAVAIIAAPFTGGTSLTAIVLTASLAGGAGATTGGITYWATENPDFFYGKPTLFNDDVNILNKIGVSSFEIAP